MTEHELDELADLSPQAQLVVLLRTIENLQRVAINATQVWLTVGGRRDAVTADAVQEPVSK